MPNATIKDIAREAHVSTATVSRVLNNSDSVTLSTREKVNAAIQKMNYTPSTVARNLSKMKTTTIGVLIPQIDNPFFGAALRGITEVADKNGFAIMCFNTDDFYDKDIHAINMMKEHRIAGMLFTPATSYDSKRQKNSIISHLKSLDCPIVCFDRCISDFDVDEVIFDDEAAVYEAVSRVIAAGHTKIGLINGDKNSYLGRIRLKGYLRALQDADLPVRDEYLFFGNFRKELGYKHSMELLSLDDRPTCVMLCNNEITCGFLQALLDLNLTLTKDIACVGLDRLRLLELAGINFNYIERDSNMLGRTAAELLISRIQNPDAPTERRILKPNVVCNNL